MKIFRKPLLIFLLGIFFTGPFLVFAQVQAQEAAEGGAGETVQAELPEETPRDPPVEEAPLAGEIEQTIEHSIEQTIEQTVEADVHPLGFFPRLGIAFLVLIIQAVLIRLVWALFRRLNEKSTTWGMAHIKPLTFRKLKLLNTKQIIEVILFVLKILKYVVTAFQLYITLPIIFSLFSATEDIARTLFGYILTPLRDIFFGTIAYIPKLITIIIILLVTRYVIRALKFFSVQIEKEKLVFPGFYADWAKPTFNILRVLLYAFTAAIIYPYLPGSDSKFFQGISVFIGVIFSLGSSSAIGNLVAGMVITYMRPFKIGDFIKIKDLTGTVVEKSPFVVRIMNKKNEYITFPNVTVLTSEIINYNTSADNDEGLIMHAAVTMGYTVPWPKVHEILIAAAKKTSRTEKSPKPYVLQTALDDFYARYEINVFTKQINELPGIYSELYANIQDGFNEAGISLIAPHYGILNNAGNE
ncbi:hypothetical protein AGMMS49928_13000 [Spirochaetia bacterium]|nr:hypothetical protein AGMMS49928_13000 [Spirochaetia bacterium]